MGMNLKKIIWSFSLILIAIACVAFMPRELAQADTSYLVTFDYNTDRIEKYISSDPNCDKIISSMTTYSRNVAAGTIAREIEEKKPDVELYKYYSYKWSVNGVIQDINTYAINANTKFVAVWTPTPYYVSYSYAADVVDDIENLELGVSYTVESPRLDYYKPRREHYRFVDWHSSSHFTLDNIEIYRPSGSIGDKTLYPEWAPIEYSINYNTDAENVDNPTSYDVESGTYTLIAPEKEGHIFKGWYLDPEYTVVCKEIVSANGGDIDLYPKWELETYDITYVLPSGETQVIEAKYGQKAELPAVQKSIFEVIKTSEPVDNVVSDMVVYIQIVNIWYVYAIALLIIGVVAVAIVVAIKKKKEMHSRLRHIYQSNLTRFAKRKGK